MKKILTKNVYIETNKFINKITQNLENFSYNVIIANIYELYRFFFKRIREKIYSDYIERKLSKYFDDTYSNFTTLRK